MKLSLLEKTFKKTFFILTITGWTILVVASYYLGELWFKDHFFSHLFLWFIGAVGLGIVLTWYYKAANGDDTKEAKIGSLIYRAMLETSPDSVAATDLLGNYIFANEQTAILHGYSSTEEFVGKNALSLIALKDVTKATKYMDKTRTDGIIKNIEFNLLRKDGTTFPAELSAALVRNEFGIPVAFIAVTRDITNRKQASEQLARANGQLQKQIQEIEMLQESLREQAIRDPLTDLFNRRYMKEATVQEHARAIREDYPYSLIMIDMDKLKDINDTYGHAAGDLAIRTLAKQIKKNTRIEDTACRYGGDEFLILLHDTPTEVANDRVESWRINLLENPLLLQGQPVTVTFTAGIATFPMHGQTLDEMLHQADRALYEAKATGGNRVLMIR